MSDSSPAPRVTRRKLVTTTGGAAAGAYLAAAGLRGRLGPAGVAAQEPAGPGTTVGSDFLLRAPEEAPKRGGVLKIAGLGDPAQYDIDQSPSIGNLYPQ